MTDRSPFQARGRPGMRNTVVRCAFSPDPSLLRSRSYSFFVTAASNISPIVPHVLDHRCEIIRPLDLGHMTRILACSLASWMATPAPKEFPTTMTRSLCNESRSCLSVVAWPTVMGRRGQRTGRTRGGRVQCRKGAAQRVPDAAPGNLCITPCGVQQQQAGSIPPFQKWTLPPARSRSCGCIGWV